MLFQILSLKIIEFDDYKLTPGEILEYAEKFKIILENKNKMNSNVYQFIIMRLIDNVLLASMLIFEKKTFVYNNYCYKETFFFQTVIHLIEIICVLAYHMPEMFNKNVMTAYYPYFAERLYMVSMLICERNIYILSEMSNSQKSIISGKITAWIQYFIENDFLTIDELTYQIMSILKLSWPEVIP